MRARVQWALFCRDLATDDRGLTSVSDLVHVLAVQPNAAELWLVASIEGAPNRRLAVTLRPMLSGRPTATLPTQQVTLSNHGFAELKVKLPPVPLSEPGTFSVDLTFSDEPNPAERVAVRIAAPSAGPPPARRSR